MFYIRRLKIFRGLTRNFSCICKVAVGHELMLLSYDWAGGELCRSGSVQQCVLVSDSYEQSGSRKFRSSIVHSAVNPSSLEGASVQRKPDPVVQHRHWRPAAPSVDGWRRHAWVLRRRLAARHHLQVSSVLVVYGDPVEELAMIPGPGNEVEKS